MSASPSPSERKPSTEGTLKDPHKNGVRVDHSEKGVAPGEPTYDDDDSPRPTALKRQLKNRHVAMIRLVDPIPRLSQRTQSQSHSIGGVIGTGEAFVVATAEEFVLNAHRTVP